MTLDVGIGGAGQQDQTGQQGQGGGGVRTTPVPGGGQVVTWAEPNPNYDPTSPSYGNYNQPYITHTQFVPASSSGDYTHTTERLIDPAQIETERIRAQNQIDIANLQHQIATEKNALDRQQLEQQLAEKYAELSGNLPGGGQTLDAQRFGFDQFKYLSDLAANPRNFMQQFYIQRGFQPPAGSSAFGTGGANLPGYAMPSFLGGARTSTNVFGPPPDYAGAPASTNPRAGGVNTPGLFGTAANPNPMPTPVQAGPVITERQAGDTRPDSQLTAPSTYYGAGGQGAQGQQFRGVQGQAIAFNDHADAPIVGAPGGLDQPKQITGYASGGITPEPIMGVGMRSNPQMFRAMQGAPGHKYLLGERGPEGVVPASYLPKFLQSRTGQRAMAGNLASGDAPMGTSQMGMTTAYGDGGMVGAPQGASGGDLMAMFARGGRMGMPMRDLTAYAIGGVLGADTGTTAKYDPYGGSPYTTPDPTLPINQTTGTAAPTGGSGPALDPGATNPATNPFAGATPSLTADQVAALTSGATVGGGSFSGGGNAAPPTTPNGATPNGAPPQAPSSGPSAPPQQPTGGTPGPFPGEPGGGYVLPPAPPAFGPPVQQPVHVPQGAETSPVATPGAVTPRAMAPAGTFGEIIGNGPSFGGSAPTLQDSMSSFAPYLPQFLSGEDTPLANLVNQGILPPFLGRMFAQQHGSSEYATNRPQMRTLPADVPLISNLAYLQMSPNERSAFESYLSSYGIDPQDYFDYVRSVSPQGPSAKEPLFGTPFSYNVPQG